jgi:hypothetical protein
MRHVRDSMAEDYLVMKDQIRKLAQEQQVVDFRDFERICGKHGIASGKAALMLGESGELEL